MATHAVRNQLKPLNTVCMRLGKYGTDSVPFFFAELISKTDAGATFMEPLEIAVDFSKDEVVIVSLRTIYLLQFDSTRIFRMK